MIGNSERRRKSDRRRMGIAELSAQELADIMEQELKWRTVEFEELVRKGYMSRGRANVRRAGLLAVYRFLADIVAMREQMSEEPTIIAEQDGVGFPGRDMP